MTGNAMWRKSSYSGGSGGNCVEVRGDTGRVLVRDTKDRNGPVLPFTPEAWRRFADSAKRSLAGPRASIYGRPGAWSICDPCGQCCLSCPPARHAKAPAASRAGPDGRLRRTHLIRPVFTIIFEAPEIYAEDMAPAEHLGNSSCPDAPREPDPLR
jgi:hypothetical protein